MISSSRLSKRNHYKAWLNENLLSNFPAFCCDCKHIFYLIKRAWHWAKGSILPQFDATRMKQCCILSDCLSIKYACMLIHFPFQREFKESRNNASHLNDLMLTWNRNMERFSFFSLFFRTIQKALTKPMEKHCCYQFLNCAAWMRTTASKCRN